MSAGSSAAARLRSAATEITQLIVIGAGFGRTGTDSILEALEILGLGPCYPVRDVFKTHHCTTSIMDCARISNLLFTTFKHLKVQTH